MVQPDQNVSDAVDVRQELDLRIGELVVAPTFVGVNWISFSLNGRKQAVIIF